MCVISYNFNQNYSYEVVYVCSLIKLFYNSIF